MLADTQLPAAGNSIGQSKLPRDFVACIGEQRKAQLVLVVHEERLLHRLRRDSDERRSSLLDLRQDEVHSFHLSYTKRTPASANETHHKLSLGEQVGR